jgi:hypothetical protein
MKQWFAFPLTSGTRPLTPEHCETSKKRTCLTHEKPPVKAEK